MIAALKLAPILSASTWALVACVGAPDTGVIAAERDDAVQEIQRQAGAPVALELGATGDVRVLTMAAQFPLPGRAGDPAMAAREFLATHHRAFQLEAGEAGEFVVARVDDDHTTGLRHVTLDRVYQGIPVFQGAITVHMDSGNRVFRALGDEFYRVTEPTNQMTLSPSEAATAAGRALGVELSPTLGSREDQATTFESAGALEPLKVEPRIVQVSPDDARYAYQVLVAWLDHQHQQQYQLALVDAATGALLAHHSLVSTFSGRVFGATAQPTAGMTADTRRVVSFDGNPTASPQGWVGAARNTSGNNATAATDLDGNNAIGPGETQPVANAGDSFDFPFSPMVDASMYRPAAVTNAFYLVNDWHDRTYLLGFNEAAGNFQANNFGKGGAQNDPVNVDVQDGSGINNANFASPPDGSRPRMQMFLFTLNGGAQEDGGFDPTVVFHEATHGLSNRLVGGGSTGCLGGLQSGGMSEGWGDFLAASFLGAPIVGAYVSGNVTVGVRRMSMANSPFTFNDLKTGNLAEIHDLGELWAATLWDARKAIGKAAIEQLVVAGMKLTPCSPTLLQARDAILQADANINGGANRCKLWQVFAARQMGTGASSQNHNATTTIVPSAAIPTDCNNGVPVHWSSTASPGLHTLDNGTVCTSATVVTTTGTASAAKLDISGTHAYRPILRATLSHDGGLPLDAFLPGTFPLNAGTFSFANRPVPGFTGSAAGTWTLCIIDTDRFSDTGVLNSWSVHD